MQGWRYEGEFRNNRFDGEGELEQTSLPDTGGVVVHSGSFSRHQPHGPGEVRVNGRVTFRGLFVDGCRVTGTSIDPSTGVEYTGAWIGELRHGLGRLSMPPVILSGGFSAPGLSYEGLWVSGAPSEPPSRAVLEWLPSEQDQQQGEVAATPLVPRRQCLHRMWPPDDSGGLEDKPSVSAPLAQTNKAPAVKAAAAKKGGAAAAPAAGSRAGSASRDGRGAGSPPARKVVGSAQRPPSASESVASEQRSQASTAAGTSRSLRTSRLGAIVLAPGGSLPPLLVRL